MDASEAARRFAELFHGVYLAFHRRAARGERRLGPEGLAVLSHLAVTGPLTIAEACAHFARSQAAMSDLVTRLERRGLVARVLDGRDRRRTLVWLSEEGRRRLRVETTVLESAALRAALGDHTEEEREALLRSLERLLAAGSRTRTAAASEDEETP